jgi:peroxiredoxin
MNDLSRIRERIEGKKNPLNNMKQLINKYPFASIALGLLIIGLLGWGIFSLISSLLCSNIPVVPDNQSSTVNPPVTVTYPEISDITVTDITQSTATINWRTDILTTGEIKYWTDDKDNSTSANDTEFKLIHSIMLIGLNPDTTYYFSVTATNEAGYKTPSEISNPFTTTSGAISVSPEVGYMAPEFALPDLDGNTVALSDYLGKWLIVSFWETGCQSCRSTLPHLQKYYEAMPADKIQIVSINYKEKNKITLISLVKNRGVTFPVLLDDNGTVSQDYKITGFPTLFFIDDNGIVQKVVTRKFDSMEEIEQFVSSVADF